MINKVIRFVWIDTNDSHKLAEIPKTFQICIMSAAVINPDYKIVIHTNIPLNYDMLKDNGEIVNEIIPERLLNEAKELGIRKIQHISDYVRYSILYEEGGIYLDTDMFCLKKFDSLLDKRCVLGRESVKAICCAVIMCEKNHELIKRILNEYKNNYKPNSWVYNSQSCLREFSKDYKNGEVTILSLEEGFFYPNYKSVKTYYEEFPLSSIEDVRSKYSGYAQHLWNANVGRNLVKYISNNIGNNEDKSYISQLFNLYIKKYYEKEKEN